MKCLLITGMGHSGTRLATKMLAEHPDVFLPELNRVSEYTPLHEFFIDSMDRTDIDSGYVIDTDRLQSILESYLRLIPNIDFFILKLPYYPLNCLNSFKFFNPIFINIKRPKHKVIKSFKNKGEDKSLFIKENIRQIKKLPIHLRHKHKGSKDAESFFSDLYDHVQNLTKDFIQIDIEQFATDKDYITKILKELGIYPCCEERMMKVVNKNRLLKNTKRHLRKIIPPQIISWLVNISNRKSQYELRDRLGPGILKEILANKEEE